MGGRIRYEGTWGVKGLNPRRPLVLWAFSFENGRTMLESEGA